MKLRDTSMLTLSLITLLLIGVYSQASPYYSMIEESYIRLNKFRTDLSYLKSFTEHEFDLRVYDEANDLEFPFD